MMKLLIQVLFCLLILSPELFCKQRQCPFKELSDEVCVLKRAIVGLMQQTHSVQDMEHKEDIQTKISKKKVLLELTPKSLDVIDDSHEAGIIRSVPLEHIAVINQPKVWLDNRVFCIQIVSQKNNRNGIHIVSDYVYGQTDIDFALCFKDSFHKDSWVNSIVTFSKCDKQSYDSLQDEFKKDIVHMQREEDNKHSMEFSRLNKKINSIIGSTIQLKNELKVSSQKMMNKKTRFMKKNRHQKKNIMSDDIAKDNTFGQLNQHNNKRFSKKLQMLKLLQRAVYQKNKKMAKKQVNKKRANKQMNQQQFKQKIAKQHQQQKNLQKQKQITNNRNKQRKQNKHFRFRNVKNVKNVQRISQLKSQIGDLINSVVYKNKKSCPRKSAGEHKMDNLEQLLQKHEENKEQAEHGPENMNKEELIEQFESSSNPIQQQMAHALKNNKHAKVNSFHSESEDENQNQEVTQGGHHQEDHVDIGQEMKKITNKMHVKNVGHLIKEQAGKINHSHSGEASSSLLSLNANLDMLLKKSSTINNKNNKVYNRMLKKKNNKNNKNNKINKRH